MLDVPAGSYASYWFVLVLLQILTERSLRKVGEVGSEGTWSQSREGQGGASLAVPHTSSEKADFCSVKRRTF